MEKWFYIGQGNQHGPVDRKDIIEKINKGEIKNNSYLWRKGLKDWIQLEFLNELRDNKNYLNLQGDSSRLFFIRIGHDRGQDYKEYGPYNLDTIKQLFEEKRINGKTLIFYKGLQTWTLLADFHDFTEVFNNDPPKVTSTERRKHARKPFYTSLLLHDGKKLIDGICRDISLGGLQILIDNHGCKQGDIITLNIHPEKESHQFTAKGKILRLLNGDKGIAIEFHELSSEAETAIATYLKSVA